jgi:hypothetical protein
MMDDGELVAIAKTMVPFVRECVAEAVGKTMVPPELAEQVAAAVRLLHESPVLAKAGIAEIKETPRPIPPRVTRIERDEDGNLVPIYGEQQP